MAESKKDSALIEACRNNQQDKLTNLLKSKKFDIHAPSKEMVFKGSSVAKGGNAMHVASERGHASIVELLLSDGANLNSKDNVGRSPLHLAASNGHFSVVKVLMSKGANVNQTDENGNCSIHMACRDGHADIIELLLSNGANINHINTAIIGGNTPLMIASQNGNVKTVDLLLHHGADVNLRKSYGKSALFVAVVGDFANTVALLLSRGANIRDLGTEGTGLARLHILYILRKWPTSMAIIILKELGLFYHFDMSSIIDLHQYLGKEDFTTDNEEAYPKDEDGLVIAQKDPFDDFFSDEDDEDDYFDEVDDDYE